MFYLNICRNSLHKHNQDIENHILIIFPTNPNILRLFNQGFEVAYNPTLIPPQAVNAKKLTEDRGQMAFGGQKGFVRSG